jgi:hypothetical protein
MFKLDSEDALRAAFRPKDRESLEVSKEVVLPALVRDYLAWRQPAGAYLYLVFAVPGGVPTGIVFEVNGGADPSVPQMCDWCHTTGVGSGVALLTATLNTRKRVGVHVCADLSCKQKLEDAASRGGYSALPSLQKLVERIGRFASEALKIDLSGAGR